jgi:SAM-dependent methyltransferase
VSERRILSAVEAYYTARVREFGETPRGVDWSTEASQTLRFEKLLELVRGQVSFTMLDFGCGYGALLDQLRGRGQETAYTGFDVSAEMIDRARRRHGGCAQARFTDVAETLEVHDFVVASGIFNVKLDQPDSAWLDYVLATLDTLNSLARRGFAFNALSLYSDVDRRKDHLYYADPMVLFDRCKRKYSPRVALLHDYPLWEFTLLVRKGPE